jgi:hypothetical protein
MSPVDWDVVVASAFTSPARDQAFANIRAAAEHYGVEVAEDDWRQLGKRPHTRNPAR